MTHTEPTTTAPTATVPTRRHEPRFELGQIVSTPGALGACSREHMSRCLARHLTGDWGCVDAEDAETNNEALVLRLSHPLRLPHRPREAVRRFREKHALDHHRGRPERDHLPAAGRILTATGRTLVASARFFQTQPKRKTINDRHREHSPEQADPVRRQRPQDAEQGFH